MKILTWASFKGGAGKTTSLMVVASSLVNQGHTVALFEADANAPLITWKERAKENDAWDDKIDVQVADEVDSFAQSLEAAEKAGVDYVLIDTAGGASDLNDTILVNSHVVVVPAALTTLDVEACIETMEHATRLFQSAKVDVPFAVLIQQYPVGKLTATAKEQLALLTGLPCFDARLPKRDAFAAVPNRGLLHRYAAQVSADPTRKLNANHLTVAMTESDVLTTSILEAL